MIEIYAVVDKAGKRPTKSSGWKDARKLLVYTSEARARAALKSRGLSAEDYEIIPYIAKGDE